MKRYDYPTEVLEVTVRHLDDAGQGIALYRHPADPGNMGKSLKLIIPNTVPGDVIKIEVSNAKGRRSARMNSFELIKPSSDRNVTHPIKKSIAGGAPLQYMKYDAQLNHKEKTVRKYFKKEGFDTSIIQPIIGLEKPNHYRNKMEFTFGPNGEIGMHEQGNFKHIIDLEDSILAPQVMIDIKDKVKKWQQDFQLSGYNKETTEGLLRQMVIRKSFLTNEVMIVIFATEAADERTKASQELANRLTKEYDTLVSFLWVKSTNVSDQVATEEVKILHGRDYITEELNGFCYKLYLNTFFQANSTQAERMVQTALEMAEVHSDMCVLELFCGIGTFSLPFAKRVKELIGIEVFEQSIVSARENAKKAELGNTHFFVSDARKGLDKLKEAWEKSDLLVINPPRSGAGGKLMRSIGQYGSEKIIYISCNPKTLADDLKWLRPFGYKLKSVQPIDQFAHTVHVETVLLLSKKDSD